MKIQGFCNECNIITEHDHEESISEDVKTTIDVCFVCGNADVDADSVDVEYFLDFDDYPDDIGGPNDEQKCRVCGCTWDHACPGGCYWVEEDLCSACFEKEKGVEYVNV